MCIYYLFNLVLSLHVCIVLYHFYQQICLLKNPEELVLRLLTRWAPRWSRVDTANKMCNAYIKHQWDWYAQWALYPVKKTGGSFEVWLQWDVMSVCIPVRYIFCFKCLLTVAADLGHVLLVCLGCSAVLLEIACGAVASQWPPQPVPPVCNNNLVFTPQTMI